MFVRFCALAAAMAMTGCATSQANETAQLSALPADQQAFLDTCKPWDDWDKPAPPFKIHGDSYYVGTCGISAILIVGDEGHILLDSGTEAGADVVASNIEALGFALTDVKVITHSHEHFDHVGGLAKLQELTGAQVFSSPEAAPVLMLTGKAAQDDPQFGMHDPMSTVSKLTVLKGEAQVWDERPGYYSLDDAGLRMRAIATPGHTPGALSWTWSSCEGENCRTIVYADSLSPVSADGYRFSDHPEYVAEYYAGINRLGAVDCDILIAAHPSHGQMFQWLEKGSLLAMEKPCLSYASKKRSDLDKRLAKEAAE